MALRSPAFDSGLANFDMAAWVSSASNGLGPSANGKLANSVTDNDMFGFSQQSQESSNFDFVNLLGGIGDSFDSPSYDESATVASVAPSGAAASVAGLLNTTPIKSETLHSLNPNALQLDVVDPHTMTPTCLSPRTMGTASGYTSPAFQLSPTPGLTMCPTVDSTPAPRSNSRCSSRSSFSLHTADAGSVGDGCHSALTSAVTTPMMSPSLPLLVSSAGGRKNSAVANGSFKPKRPHLCPFHGCERATRTFRSNADLQRHIRSHNGERPHQCPAPGCDKAYGQQNKMVKHVEQQHPQLLPLVELRRTRTRRAPAAAAAAANTVATRNSAPRRPGQASPIRLPPMMTTSPVSFGAFINQHTANMARAAPYPLPASLALQQQQGFAPTPSPAQRRPTPPQYHQNQGHFTPPAGTYVAQSLSPGIQLHSQQHNWWSKDA